MNGKKAKALRRIARQQTNGMPAREYTDGKRYVKHTDADGNEQVSVLSGSRMLLPSTRKTYQALKRA